MSKRKIRLNTNRVRLDFQPHPLWCVRQKELADYLGCHTASIWRAVRDGNFPAPIALPSGMKVWRIETVKRWLEQLEADQAEG